MDALSNSKNPKAVSHWVSYLTSRITASGAPSRKRLQLWKDQGVTDIITLLRSDEMQAWLPSVCDDLGIIWHHYPLSGKLLEDPDDISTLSRIPKLVSNLSEHNNRSIVVHCAAGMHRTGIFLYILLRCTEFDPEHSVELIAQARKLTAEELSKTTKQGVLLTKAEMIYQSF